MIADLIEGSLFREVTAILVVAAVVALVGMKLRQPLIVSFIAVGLLVGPSALGLAGTAEADPHLHLFAELGIALLLFLVGLKLDLGLVRTLGPVALMTGLGQVGFTSVFGFLICLALGMDWVTSLYIAVALTFSSTIIIVKLLSDKREVDSLHGRIALGFLIVQDIVVVIAMVVLSAIAAGQAAGTATSGTGGAAGEIAMVFFWGAVMVAASLAIIRWVATPLTRMLAGSPELLIAFAVAWATLFAAVGDYLGFSKELGGLLAGVTLASTPLRETLASRLSPLRDFLLLFFFVGLGAQLDLGLVLAQVPEALLLSAFVLVGNPLIVLAIMAALGYAKRTGFLAGLTVAQISEFSLIFVAMGVTLGHVGPEALGLTTFVGIVTIASSTYMILNSHRLWAVCEPWLGWFAGRPERREDAVGPVGPDYDTIVFGMGRYGGGIAQGLAARGHRVLGVDFDPTVTKGRGGPDLIFGDASDPEFVAGLPLGPVRWVVLAVPPHAGDMQSDDPRLTLLEVLRAVGYRGQTAVIIQGPDDAARMHVAGADLTLEPYPDAAVRAADRIAAAHGKVIPA